MILVQGAIERVVTGTPRISKVWTRSPYYCSRVVTEAVGISWLADTCSRRRGKRKSEDARAILRLVHGATKRVVRGWAPLIRKAWTGFPRLLFKGSERLLEISWLADLF